MEQWQLQDLAEKVDISKVIAMLIIFKVTVVGAYLSDVDVLASLAGVANEKI